MPDLDDEELAATRKLNGVDKDSILERSIENLIRYIELDRKIRNNKIDSDFEKFCENHCKDIENLIKKVSEMGGIK